jgi:hypothetical protein
MASEDASDRHSDDKREQDSDSHSVTPPSRQSRPSPFNDGPELIRGNHC